MVNTMTTKQSDFLGVLVAERDTTSVDRFLEELRQHYREGRATTKEASDVISELLQCPKRAGGTITEGIYEDVGTSTLYRAYLGQNNGRMLCKRVVFDGKDISYDYQGLASRFLQDARRLTREEVAERTLAYGSGTCMVCGRRLDDPESVDRGIGPVCWGNYS